MLKLKFIGMQEDGLGNQLPLWNVINSPRPQLNPDGSTVTQGTWLLLYSIQCLFNSLSNDFGTK